MALRKIRFEVKIGQFEGRFGCDLPWPGRWVTEAFSRPYFWAAGGLDIGPREAGCWATKGASRPGRWASKIGPRFANARIALWIVLSRAKIFRGNGLCGLKPGHLDAAKKSIEDRGFWKMSSIPAPGSSLLAAALVACQAKLILFRGCKRMNQARVKAWAIARVRVPAPPSAGPEGQGGAAGGHTRLWAAPVSMRPALIHSIT